MSFLATIGETIRRLEMLSRRFDQPHRLRTHSRHISLAQLQQLFMAQLANTLPEIDGNRQRLPRASANAKVASKILAQAEALTLASARFSQKKVLEDELAIAGRKWCSADLAI